MEDGFGLKTALTDIFDQLRAFTVDMIPRLISGLVVLLVGLIIAKIVQKVVQGALSRLRFDSLMERVGVSEVLAGIGMRGSLSFGIARLLYYLLVILFVQGAAGAVGLTVVGEAISSFFAYLPRLVTAVLIVILGNLIGQFARKAVEESGRNSGVEYAAALGRVVSASIMFIVAIMAIAQLGIETAMIRIVVIAGLAGSAAAFAISFGLGTRDVTRNIVAGFYARKIFRIGDEVEIQGQRGTLTAITPTQALLDQDGTTVAIANSHFLDSTVRQ